MKLIYGTAPWWAGVPTTLLRKTPLVTAAQDRLPVYTLTFAIPSSDDKITPGGKAQPHADIALDLGDVVKMVIPGYKPKSYSVSALRDDEFDVTDCGVHLSAEDFNELTDKEETILIDMRNHYESEVGHFEGAICPDVDTFRDSLPIIEEDLKEHKEDKNLVMYCTGGIRCEKASAYYKHKGFKNVYQLEGGIIEYTRQVKEQELENKFLGKNFVFDHRRSERISQDIISNCHQCGKPCDTHTNCENEGCHLLFIQCEECAEKMEGCCSTDCQDIIHLPEKEQKAIRKGKHNSNKIFRKGRSENLTFKQTVSAK